MSKAGKITIVTVFIYAGLLLLNSVVKYAGTNKPDVILIVAVATIPMAMIIIASKYWAKG